MINSITVACSQSAQYRTPCTWRSYSIMRSILAVALHTARPRHTASRLTNVEGSGSHPKNANTSPEPEVPHISRPEMRLELFNTSVPPFLSSSSPSFVPSFHNPIPIVSHASPCELCCCCPPGDPWRRSGRREEACQLDLRLCRNPLRFDNSRSLQRFPQHCHHHRVLPVLPPALGPPSGSPAPPLAARPPSGACAARTPPTP
ncbi:hypothetical protein C8T65DRAFT_59797 [Cerioporus squamosus]|nr:hypothetical protein C8T65DRAFT_59797 [Cerioporus squamosus]